MYIYTSTNGNIIIYKTELAMQSLDMISMNKDPVPLMQKKTQDPLVGGFNHLEIYEFVNGKVAIPYKYKNHL
jgi:hypothetical protein